nr:hypothetical protein BaRGS_031290 [Batillaria attramentaria]
MMMNMDVMLDVPYRCPRWVEEAAEGRVSEQRNVIERLTQDLAEKERQIQGLRLELQRVKERDAAGTPARSLSSDSHVEDIRERQKLEDELARKKHELENLNTLLTEAKRDESRKDERGGNTKRPRQKTEKGNQAEEGDVHDFGKGHVQSQRADASSLNTEDEAASDMSTSQASVSLSHSFGSSTKDRSNTLKKLKQNLVSRRSDISSQYSSTQSEARQHVARPSRADQLQTQRLKDKKNALVEQMKELLTKATTENEKLKGELTAKENQLQVLNQQLERTKTDQTELMEETFDLYKEAENSLGKLKDMLKAKEAQLEQANTRMDEIRTEQEKLAAEKQNIALHADQKDSQYQNMLQERDEQISRLNHLLASQQEERDRLTEMAADLKREVQEKEKTQQDLSKAIADKEQELSKARESAYCLSPSDVEALSTFLQTAAAKESVARGKLEAFVTELIDRADRAERELRHLRGLESSSSGNLTSDLSQDTDDEVEIFDDADFLEATTLDDDNLDANYEGGNKRVQGRKTAAFSGIMQKIGYDTSDSAEKQAPATEDKHEESTPIVGQNPVTVISPLQRQSSVTTDESSDMKKYENADLVPAKQLRARFSHASNSSLQSSSDSLSPPMPRAQSPILPRPPSPQDKGDNDSTDFDLESDLEKFTAPGIGAGFSGMRRGLATGKPGGKKMAQKKTRAKRYAAAKNTQQLAAPDIMDVQSCQRLQLLSLDHVKEMDDDTATALCRSGLRQLQRLEISGTPVTAKAIRTFCNSCRHLKEIKIVLSIADIFEDTRKKKNKEQYKKVKHSLEVTEFSL